MSFKIDLDDFDLQILRHLQKDALLTNEKLATLVSLSPSSIQRRVKRLRDSGVISHSVSIIDPAVIGGRLRIVVHISFENEQPDKIQKVKKQLLGDNQVQQCFYVTGSSDLIIILAVKSMQDFNDTTKRYLLEDENIRRFDTFVVLETLKENFGFNF